MRALKRNDMPGLRSLLGRLKVAGSFTGDEIECALELLQLVLDQPGQKDYLVQVAEGRDGLVGYVLYGPVPLTVSTFDIYWIATSPQVHGQGFGRRLLEAAERDMKKRSARMICLETSSKSAYDRTRAFYENAGYRQEAVLVDFYRPGDDRITYVKRFS